MNHEIEAYFALLCETPPSFLSEYLQAPEIQRLKGIGLFCGTDYSKLYDHKYFFSRFDHSYATALIVWNFTKNESQCIAALLHDIATPVFSHSVDFMNGDSMTQTSTEANTRAKIASSGHIMRLLARDGIGLPSVEDYHIYPIADNEMPRLSSDRLEYTLSTMLAWQKKWSIDDIRGMYRNIRVCVNEDNVPELGFIDLDAAERFMEGACANAISFQRNDNKLSLSMLGDILKLAIQANAVEPDELYALTEPQLIQRLDASGHPGLRKAWQAYTRLSQVFGSDTKPESGYVVHLSAKRRYIDPLVQSGERAVRATEASQRAEKLVRSALEYADKAYAYIDPGFDRIV
ncbi:MAG TPA: hypothetical protein PKE04_13405 [Clostridia bacterium]|nr:hypothetical protein [Clostridia bacterium]